MLNLLVPGTIPSPYYTNAHFLLSNLCSRLKASAPGGREYSAGRKPHVLTQRALPARLTDDTHVCLFTSSQVILVCVSPTTFGSGIFLKKLLSHVTNQEKNENDENKPRSVIEALNLFSRLIFKMPRGFTLQIKPGPGRGPQRQRLAQAQSTSTQG